MSSSSSPTPQGGTVYHQCGDVIERPHGVYVYEPSGLRAMTEAEVTAYRQKQQEQQQQEKES